MQNDPLNTAPIQQFISQVKSADLANAKEVKLSLQQAKNLSYTLGIVMARLEGDLERFVKENSSSTEVVQVQLDGGTGWE